MDESGSLIEFPSADGAAILTANWHLPTRRATNAAILIMHDGAYDKDSALSLRLAQSCAAIGLSAIRFNFRYVAARAMAQAHGLPREQWPGVSLDGRDECDDLDGAWQWLQAFGKEMKPRRIYVAGISVGAITALWAATRSSFAADIAGVIALMPVYAATHNPFTTLDGQRYDLATLRTPTLFVTGDRDMMCPLERFKLRLATLGAPHRLVVLPNVTQGFFDADALDDATLLERNIAATLQISVTYLDEIDKPLRPNFRI